MIKLAWAHSSKAYFSNVPDLAGKFQTLYEEVNK